MICAEPDAAIPRRKDRPNSVIRQTLFRRNRGHDEIAKVVEAASGGYPNIAFTILEETCNQILGETVRLRKHIRPSLVYMQKSPVESSDPQTAIAIP